MAKSIVVDPARLESAAGKMESQKEDYQRIYRQLFSEVDGMGAAWQGADNQAFVSQIKGFEDDFQKMVNLMKQYADFLREAAKTYRNKQNEIIDGAKRLSN